MHGGQLECGGQSRSGRLFIVTGASSGIGAAAAEVLAGRGATVILAVRDRARGAATREHILTRYPGARVEIALVDMAELASVAAFADVKRLPILTPDRRPTLTPLLPLGRALQ